MSNTIKNKKIRDELYLSNDKIFTEEVFDEIRKLIDYRFSNAELSELFVALEISRRIGDNNLVTFYKNRIAGILGLPYN
jgi:hypothetical protein